MIINQLLGSQQFCIRRLVRTTCGLNRWSRNSSVLCRDRWCSLTFYCMPTDCLMAVFFPKSPNRPMLARRHPDWRNWSEHSELCIGTAPQIEPRPCFWILFMSHTFPYYFSWVVWGNYKSDDYHVVSTAPQAMPAIAHGFTSWSKCCCLLRLLRFFGFHQENDFAGL